MSTRPTAIRINDPEVKKRLNAYKERMRIKKLQKEYDEVFKDIEPSIGDVFWETDIDELPSMIDNPLVTYSADIRRQKTNNRIVNQLLSRRSPGIDTTRSHDDILAQISDRNSAQIVHDSIVDRMRNRQEDVRASSPPYRYDMARNGTPTLDEAINHLHDNIGSNLGMRRPGNTERMDAYDASKEPFYHKIWFKIGIPSTFTILASLAEIWKAFH